MNTRLLPCSLAGLTLALLSMPVGNAPASAAPRVLKSVGQPPRVMQTFSIPASPHEQSLSNLKMIGLGIVQYEQDHDERAPDAAHWVDQIMPYVQDKKYFHDPSAPAGQTYNYAYNRTFSHQSLAAMEDPSHSVIAFESTKGVKNASDTGQSIPHPGRHKGGTDYLFADGHAKWFKDGTKLSFKLTGK